MEAMSRNKHSVLVFVEIMPHLQRKTEPDVRHSTVGISKSVVSALLAVVAWLERFSLSCLRPQPRRPPKVLLIRNARPGNYSARCSQQQPQLSAYHPPLIPLQQHLSPTSIIVHHHVTTTSTAFLVHSVSYFSCIDSDKFFEHVCPVANTGSHPCKPHQKILARKQKMLRRPRVSNLNTCTYDANC